MINVVVEGASDEGAARAVVVAAGQQVAKVVVKNGKRNLDPMLANYNRAAANSTWVVFRDTDTKCPVELSSELKSRIGTISPRFELRLVHPMSEGWLLADTQGFSSFFQVKPAQVPLDVELLTHPKNTMLQICASSRSREIRDGMVSRSGQAGPLFTYYVNRYALESWNVGAARERSDSLSRAIERIRQLPA